MASVTATYNGTMILLASDPMYCTGDPLAVQKLIIDTKGLTTTVRIDHPDFNPVEDLYD